VGKATARRNKLTAPTVLSFDSNMHSSLYFSQVLVNSMYQASNSTLVRMCHQLLHQSISCLIQCGVNQSTGKG
jgi:hypothetical protein